MGRKGEKEMGRRGERVFVQGFVCLFAFFSFVFSPKVFSQSGNSKISFPIVSKNQIAGIYVSAQDFKVARIAAEAFAGDVELISGKRPAVKTDFSALSKNSIIIGTIGKNALLDKLIAEKKLDVSPIENKRESFLIANISRPFAGVENALVIVGSDRRGTAYGTFEVSGKIGVSPWVWWADSLPEKRGEVSFSSEKIIGAEPSVKYRGIFLNDEDWGLQPWAAKTFEPETGDIGPKTYAKIFELLLRLKANTCWAAMHEVTKPFNFIEGNAQTADNYAIIMGSSHAEPMLRNNVGEWKDDKAKYNFVSNEKGVTEYWAERLKTNGRYENIYTLGMRGIHDSPIQGTKTQAERIPVLEKIIRTQRNLLAKYVDVNVEQIPQIFCPYKEVLADYRAGLKVPDDVTIVFPDDNFGYIRYFPNQSEQNRTGGFGVYYHISYLGRPLSYLWLNSTPPALIFEEMSKAYENGMREFWMLNAGDIKPAEIGIELFMQMAYDAKKWNISNQNQFLNIWATREFGAKNSAKIARIMDGYYRLGFQRKPEHLQWYLPNEAARQSDLSETETIERLAEYASLRKRAEAIYSKIPAVKKDAFYELVLYPVRAASLANERFFAAELAQIHKERNQPKAIIWAQKSIAADAEIERETDYFNNKLAGGKWRGIMSQEMNEGQWKSMRSTAPKISLSDFQTSVSAEKDKKVSAANFSKSTKKINDSDNIISIEAEHFSRRNAANGFAWQTIFGLGKTGDSISVFPQKAHTFTDFSNDSPNLEYNFTVKNSGAYEALFYLIPTQPLLPSNGLRFAVSIDNETTQIVSVDKDTEVSSPKWALNILNQTTVGKIVFKLQKGAHVLKIYAVDTGVILDKIVLHTGALPTSYLAPPETKNLN